jgi:Holliday junction DNA helicase RuvA
MISFLEGELVEKGHDRVVIDGGGGGYEVLVPTSLISRLPSVGRMARVHTRMVVREDSTTLFGFAGGDDRRLFDLLTGVNGVGPKVALAFLSALAPHVIQRAIAAGDAAALTVVPGVGKKVAQRVVLDLREKLGGEGDVVVIEGPLVDVREALLALGLTEQETSKALVDVEPDGREVEELLREALQKAGR